jgi:CheY-like chemotaxis protein
MTAYAADDLIQQGMRAGVKTVLTKPIDMDFLIYLLNATRNIIG